MSAGAVVVIAVLSGIFVLIAVISDWNWFFEHPKARFFVNAFGRNGARLFYGVLGCALLLIGLYCRQFQS
jgi:hypothetical protein